MNSSPAITRYNSRGCYERSPASAASSSFPPNSETIILITRSSELMQALSEVVHHVESSVEDLPVHSDLKAVILDPDFASAVDVSWLRRAYPTSFIVVYDPTAAERPVLRSEIFDAGANMVAHDVMSILFTVKQAVLPAGLHGGSYTCPYCSLHNLTETELYYHCPAYHINWPNDVFVTKECPICREHISGPLQVHIHEDHAPSRKRSYSLAESAEAHQELTNSNKIVQLYNFSLVICKHPETGKYLLCQEFASQGFWCPGGAVDPGETMTSAAIRETKEEAGIDVQLVGILGIEFNPCGIHWRNHHNLVRQRIIFFAVPSESGMKQLPKSSPDFESAGACWCSYEEIQNKIKLRGNEPKKWSR